MSKDQKSMHVADGTRSMVQYVTDMSLKRIHQGSARPCQGSIVDGAIQL